jgi:S1-C subfamily serine protease
MAAASIDRVLRAAALVLAAFLCLTGMAGSVIAQDAEAAHAAMRKSLVYLKATGIGASGAIAGANMTATGTGFLVSEDGFILTNYHLLTELGDVLPNTIEIRANIGEKAQELKFKAATVNAVPENDLLLIKIPSGADKHVPVRLGSLAEAYAASQILTSGFPSEVDYQTVNGRVSSRDTGSGYLWTVGNMAFEHGQSGSPIYTPDGKVIGVAKGQSEGSPSLNHMIPIHLADSLIGHLRIAELQAKIATLETSIKNLETNKVDPAKKDLDTAVQNIDEIASNFEWSASINASDVEIDYRKLANTGPSVDRIVAVVTPVATNKDRQTIDIGTYFIDVNRDAESDFLIPQEFDTKKRLGVILAPNLFELVRSNFCNIGPAFAAEKFRISIQPYLKGDVPLDAETVVVEHTLTKKASCIATPPTPTPPQG